MFRGKVFACQIRGVVYNERFPVTRKRLFHTIPQWFMVKTLPRAKPIIAVHMQCEISISALQENLVCKHLTLICPGNNF